jgi:DNA repair protein RadC
MPASAVPWVRLERDPDRYADVVRRGRAFGPVRNAFDVYRLLGAAAAKEDQEVAWMVLLDTHGACRGVQEIARGARDHVGFELPDAMRAAVVAGVKYLVLVHNHPSGSAVPSTADGELTIAVETAAFESGLFLLDHVVLGLGEYYSFRERGLFRVENNRAFRVAA